MSQVGRAAWSVIAGLSVVASLWSLGADAILVPTGCCSYSDGNSTSCSNSLTNATCTGVSFNGTFSPGEVCADDASCRPALTGCCDTGSNVCFPGLENELACLGQSGVIIQNASCQLINATTSGWGVPASGVCATFTPTQTPTSTPTSTPTHTPTATATATATSTQIPDGGTCTDPSACASGYCADGVCCDTACDGPVDVCDAEGQEGTCVPGATMAPAASNTGLVLLVVALAGLALFALARRRQA